MVIVAAFIELIAAGDIGRVGTGGDRTIAMSYANLQARWLETLWQSIK